MKTYISDYKTSSFKDRLSSNKKWSIKFSLILTIGAFLFMLIKGGKSVFDDIGFRLIVLLSYFILFSVSSISFGYKFNRFLIHKLSIDKTHIYIEYDEYGEDRQIKYSLKRVKIKLVQWYHTNNIYLKISNNEVTIKQYANNGWSVEQLREVFKALKEAQKKLEGKPE